MLLANARYVITQDAIRSIREHVSIRIEGNRIAEIGTLHAKPGEHVFDCSHKAILPGLINAHTHLGMAQLRGISDDQELHSWLEKIYTAERTLTAVDIERASEHGMRESIRFGTTTVADMFFAPTAVAKAAERTGIRAILGSTYLTAHPLTAKDLHLPHDENRISFAFAPHAIYTTDEKLLKDIRAEATKTNRRILIHLCETRQERAEWKAKHGLLPVEWLEKIGFLGPDVLAAHCAWITKGELDILAKHHVKVVHCPVSNMKLAGGGVMPLREMNERGIKPALGTDGVASNNLLDMFRGMHTCAILHKHHYWDPTASDAQQVLDMATIDGATALNIKDLGSLEAGKLADLITLDLNDINLQPHSKETILSHIVYAAQGMNVSDVIIDGKLLLHEKNFIGAPQ